MWVRSPDGRLFDRFSCAQIAPILHRPYKGQFMLVIKLLSQGIVTDRYEMEDEAQRVMDQIQQLVDDETLTAEEQIFDMRPSNEATLELVDREKVTYMRKLR